jgi:predicted dehydrogenase
MSDMAETTRRRRYALVGSGGRSRMFYKAVAGRYHNTAELVALCDTNQVRMDYTNHVLNSDFGLSALPTYKPEGFLDMIKESKADTVIVTTIDRTHHKYIIAALEAGCDVITEKPMTVDAQKCQEIVDAVKRTGRSVRVTFNYRYAPHNTKIREMIADGAIGDVFAVHFEWLLDTKHGADYFRRWHRDKRNSGGLMVHKSTHHFDLVNFWLGTQPKTVFAMGDLRFYGRENAENRGVSAPYVRTTGVAAAANDPFGIDLNASEAMRELYYKAEAEDGYLRDQNVFGDGISIEDTMSVMVRYKNRAVLSYQLHAYAAWEGFNVAFNGSAGRLELSVREASYINGGQAMGVEGAANGVRLLYFPLRGEPQEIAVDHKEGSHGGGDDVMLNDIFGIPADDPLNRAAGYTEGAMSILTGIAANRSFETGAPVDVGSLVRF